MSSTAHLRPVGPIKRKELAGESAGAQPLAKSRQVRSMRVNRPSESGFLGLLHAVALSAVVVGAMVSVGLMLWVGHRNPSRILLALFVIWVLSPFMALLLA